MNMNRMLKGPQAFELGMADAMFEPADFLEQSLLWAGRVLTGETKVGRPEISRDESEWAGAVKAAKALVDLKTGGRSPAPYRALQLVAGRGPLGARRPSRAEDEHWLTSSWATSSVPVCTPSTSCKGVPSARPVRLTRAWPGR